MTYWLRGKIGGAIAFVAITGLVVGGLGWVTLAALRLEREQVEALAQAEVSNRLRVALWRLDSRMIADFANEFSRPYQHYSACEATSLEQNEKAAPVAVFELNLLPGADPPPWMAQHYLVASRSDWASPQILRATVEQHLGITCAPAPTPLPTPERRQLLTELSRDTTLKKLLTEVRVQEQQPAAWLGNASNFSADNAGQAALAYEVNQAPVQNNELQQKIDKDTALRQNRSFQAQKAGAPYQGNLDSGKTKNTKQVVAVQGPMSPLWLQGEQERLVVARLVHIGQKLTCQVTILNWPELRGLLLDEIRDLFPEASLRPIRAGVAPHPEQAMTSLPVELESGMAESAPVALGWTPVRIGLSLAWTAALLALAAVGLGGWTLLDLSERRIRFVSAVTHELRTPLTTLRLYLDMLTGGIVTDEKQKSEYLDTLHEETERLNRLVGNVLDFSRLENQRPRLEMKTIAVAEVFENVRSAWQKRCAGADKELIVDNRLDEGTAIVTDVQLVQQILGNLIDNACKYSRGAADRRIWLRACRDGKCMRLEVEDRGPGVPPRERRSIFRAFRRGRGSDETAGGVGLGLALARRWAQLLGGRVSLRPAAGTAGACFGLVLPANDKVPG